MKDYSGSVGRGIWRGVYSSITDHPDFQVLSPNARLVILVCRVGSSNTAASIFRYYREALGVQTGLSRDDLEAALCELEKKPNATTPWIVRDEQVLWIRNGLKHDPNLPNEPRRTSRGDSPRCRGPTPDAHREKVQALLRFEPRDGGSLPYGSG